MQKRNSNRLRQDSELLCSLEPSPALRRARDPPPNRLPDRLPDQQPYRVPDRLLKLQSERLTSNNWERFASNRPPERLATRPPERTPKCVAQQDMTEDVCAGLSQRLMQGGPQKSPESSAADLPEGLADLLAGRRPSNATDGPLEERFSLYAEKLGGAASSSSLFTAKGTGGAAFVRARRSGTFTRDSAAKSMIQPPAPALANECKVLSTAQQEWLSGFVIDRRKLGLYRNIV